MKKKIVLSLIAVLALGALAALAADVTGTWVAEVPGRDGATRQMTFNFVQSGETLTGTIEGGMGGRGGGGAPPAQEISEGKVSGDSLSFVIVMSFGGNEMRTSYKGTVSGSEMKLTSERPGRDGGTMTQEMTAKKQ